MKIINKTNKMSLVKALTLLQQNRDIITKEQLYFSLEKVIQECMEEHDIDMKNLNKKVSSLEKKVEKSKKKILKLKNKKEKLKQTIKEWEEWAEEGSEERRY